MIQFAGGQENLYVYCGNDGVNRVDPSGLAVIYNKPPPYTVPPTDENLAALECLDKCLAQDNLLVNGGQETSGHSKNSLHYQNKACDLAGPKYNEGLTNENVFACALQCGYSNGHYEDKPGDSKDHWHLQLEPGNGTPPLPEPPNTNDNNETESGK